MRVVCAVGRGAAPGEAGHSQRVRLSLDERETIPRGLAGKMTLTAIAAELGGSVSTISREVSATAGRTVTARRGRIGSLSRVRRRRDRASWPTC